MNNIPSKYKCLRCHKDLRTNIPADKICTCIHLHLNNYNKSGNLILKVNFDYQGCFEPLLFWHNYK